MQYMTIGAGGDFADYRTCFAWLVNPANVTDDITFDQISNVADNNQSQAFDDPHGFQLIFTCSHNEANRNNKSQWYLWTINHDVFEFFIDPWGGGSQRVTWQYLHLYRPSHVFKLDSMFRSVANGFFNPGDAPAIWRYNNCIFSGRDGDDHGGLELGGGRYNVNIITNCLFYNLFWGLETQDHNAAFPLEGYTLIENCSFGNMHTPGISTNCHGITVDSGETGIGNTIRNCVAIDCPQYGAFDAGLNDAVMENCASDDGTAFGVAKNRNIAPASEFLSTTDSDDDYMKLLGVIAQSPNMSAVPDKGRAPLKTQFSASVGFDYPGNVIANGGKTPAQNSEDFVGNPRPRSADDGTSIGCYDTTVVWE